MLFRPDFEPYLDSHFLVGKSGWKRHKCNHANILPMHEDRPEFEKRWFSHKQAPEKRCCKPALGKAQFRFCALNTIK